MGVVEELVFAVDREGRLGIGFLPAIENMSDIRQSGGR